MHELFSRHVAGAPRGLRRAENSGVSKPTREPLAASCAIRSMQSFPLSPFSAEIQSERDLAGARQRSESERAHATNLEGGFLPDDARAVRRGAR